MRSPKPRSRTLFEAFHEQHEARFGFRLDDHMEIVNFLVTGTANTGELAFPEIDKAEREASASFEAPGLVRSRLDRDAGL